MKSLSTRTARNVIPTGQKPGVKIPFTPRKPLLYHQAGKFQIAKGQPSAVFWSALLRRMVAGATH